MGNDDNNFFVIGIGNHSTPQFLGSGGEIVEAGPLHEMAMREPEALKGLWVSGHLSDYQQNQCSHQITLGETRFSYQHDWNSKTKTYFYQRENGLILKRVVSMEEEIFAGSHVLPGIAFQFIEHLRFIREPYRSHLLNCVNSDSSFEEKMTIILLAMKHLMPSWVYPEAKIPVKFSLNSNFVAVKPFAAPSRTSKTKKPANKDMDAARFRLHIGVMKAVFEGDLATLQGIAEGGYCFDDSINENLIKHAITKIDDSRQCLEVIRFLLDQGFPLIDDRSPEIASETLSIAVQRGNIEILELLLHVCKEDEEDPFIKYSIDINYQSERELRYNKPTVLECACINSQQEVLQFLIAKGGDVKRQGQRLLCAAAKTGDLEIFKILIDHGADFREKTISGKSPLILLAENGHSEAIKFAIAHGADINQPFAFCHYSSILNKVFSSDRLNGYTPLHFAAEAEQIHAVETLIALGADINARSESGKTPYAIAKEMEFSEIAELLEIKGALLDLGTTPFEKCFEHQFAVAAIISGLNREGEPIVVLGKKHCEKEHDQGRISFPWRL